MTPVLSLFDVSGDDEAIALSRRLLAFMGSGHTSIVHSQDPDRIARFGAAMPTSRILANSPGAHGVFGVTTGLVPSLTLGLRHLRRQLDDRQRQLQEPPQRQAARATGPARRCSECGTTIRAEPRHAVGALAGCAVFQGMPTERLEELARTMEWTVLDRGEVLMRTGDPGDDLYVVAGGRLNVALVGADGTETIVREIGRGSTVGEVALLTGVAAHGHRPRGARHPRRPPRRAPRSSS